MSLQIKQLDLFHSTSKKAAGVPLGAMFLYTNALCMRIKPVAYMLNSSIVQEKLASGHIMYITFESGKCSFLKGDTLVEPVTGTLSWSR